MSANKESRNLPQGWSEWHIEDELKTPEQRAGYLNAVIELDNPELLQAALGDVARAEGMSKIAEEAGLNRESLYRALSGAGNPTINTVERVLRVLGLRLQIVPLEGVASEA